MANKLTADDLAEIAQRTDYLIRSGETCSDKLKDLAANFPPENAIQELGCQAWEEPSVWDLPQDGEHLGIIIAKCPQLSWLNHSEIRMTEECFAAMLAQLPNEMPLESIHLNTVKFDGLKELLRKCPHIETLCMRGLSDEDGLALKTLFNIRVVIFQGYGPYGGSKEL